MASAGTMAAALLVSFSAVLLLLQAAPSSGHHADLLVSALDRFLDVRALLELATRRNMILLCHAILLVILRDAGLLGSRRSRSLGHEATAAVPVAAAGTEFASCSIVVWRRRRQRNRAAAPMHDDHRLVECQPAAEDAATWTWAPPPLTTTDPPAAHAEAEEDAAAAVATERIVVLEESPRNDDDDGMLDQYQYHGRDAVVETAERPTAIVAVDGERDCDDVDDDRRIVAVAATDDGDTRTREQQTAGLGMDMEMELADDRAFDEFIENQRRKMRQESMQLVSSAYHYQAIAA